MLKKIQIKPEYSNGNRGYMDVINFDFTNRTATETFYYIMKSMGAKIAWDKRNKEKQNRVCIILRQYPKGWKPEPARGYEYNFETKELDT